MLIVDSTVAPRSKAGLKRESHEDQLKKWVREQTDMAVYLEDNDLSPANAERQIGKPFTTAEFELRLKKLEPNLHFERHPHNHTKKAVFHIQNGQKVLICPYENGVMPEHSIMRQAEEYVRDFSVGLPGTAPIKRGDLPRHEWVPGEGFVWDKTEVQPGFKKILIPYGEHKRGWRTVLIRLVEKRVVTPEQVENVFGADTTPQWAVRMGKQALEIPW